ncbi:MAG TPA: ABC-F family ATP-binding cassette domain-containing protein [Thermomicrobiales bacterium]|jgi:ATP-binding cassette subfamily F protein 3
MTLLIQAASIRHAHGGNQIFEDVSFEVREGDRVALIGANGAGKSTLFKIMAKVIEPDGGVVTYRRGLAVGYLSQEPTLAPTVSMREAVAPAAGDPAALETRLRDLEAQMAEAPDDDALTAVMDEYTATLSRLEAGPGYAHEAKGAEVLAGLRIPEGRWETPFGRLSGGEKKLVGLAQLLVSEPEVLLLDEPDNHLDLDAKAWLEGYVRDHKGAVAVITHDRYFIDRAVNRIFELEDGGIESYPANYTAFVELKRERLERAAQLRDLQEREFKKLKASAEQLTQWARQNPKFAPRAENQRRKLAEERDRLEKTPPPILRRRQIEVDFDTERGSTLVLETRALAKSFGPREVFRPFDLTIRHGEVVGLVGPNGAGKTTLFRMIRGEEPPSAGTLRIGPSVVVGYYAQQQETLDPDLTPIELVRKLKPYTEQQAISFLNTLLFDRTDALNRIGNLSGGEKARLQIGALILAGANFLLLDEPTNNLDIASTEVLETALLDFPGAILTISHDRYFLDKLCTRTIEIRDGVVRDYAGGFGYYEANPTQGTVLTKLPPRPAAAVTGRDHAGARRG